MQLTTRGRYAVTAMVDITANERAGPMTLSQIADNQHISLAYLEQLFAQLKNAGLVIGLRGPGGGYKLAHPADAITVAQVVEAVNEGVDATQCHGRKNCLDGDRCLTHGLWEKLNHQLYEFLNNITFAELIEWNSVKEVVERQKTAREQSGISQTVAVDMAVDDVVMDDVVMDTGPQAYENIKRTGMN